MDTKQANLTVGADVTASVRHHHTQRSVGVFKSRVRNRKAAPQASVHTLQCCRGDEISESVKALQDDSQNEQKAKKEGKKQVSSFYA